MCTAVLVLIIHQVVSSILLMSGVASQRAALQSRPTEVTVCQFHTVIIPLPYCSVGQGGHLLVCSIL